MKKGSRSSAGGFPWGPCLRSEPFSGAHRLPSHNPGDSAPGGRLKPLVRRRSNPGESLTCGVSAYPLSQGPCPRNPQGNALRPSACGASPFFRLSRPAPRLARETRRLEDGFRLLTRRRPFPGAAKAVGAWRLPVRGVKATRGWIALGIARALRLRAAVDVSKRTRFAASKASEDPRVLFERGMSAARPFRAYFESL